MEQQEEGKKKHGPKFASLCIHGDAGIEGTKEGGDVAPPIHVSVTYSLDNDAKLVYSRADQITRRRVEKVNGYQLQNNVYMCVAYCVRLCVRILTY